MKTENENFNAGNGNLAKILPSHVFKCKELRSILKPNSLVMYFSETLEKINNHFWLIEAVAFDDPDKRIVIELKKLYLSERQKEEFIVHYNVPRSYFK